MNLNPTGITTFLTYILLPIVIAYLLSQIFTHGKPVQRKGWKNWFLLVLSIAFGIGITLITLLLGKTLHTTQIPSPFIYYYFMPTALIVTAVTLSLRGSRYLPSILIPPITILLTSLTPSTIEILKSEQTYDGTLPLYIPLVLFMLLPATLLLSAIANFIASKITPKKSLERKPRSMDNDYVFLQKCTEKYGIKHDLTREEKEDSNSTETTYTFSTNKNTWSFKEDTAPTSSRAWSTNAYKLKQADVFIDQLILELDDRDVGNLHTIFENDDQFIAAAEEAINHKHNSKENTQLKSES